MWFQRGRRIGLGLVALGLVLASAACKPPVRVWAAGDPQQVARARINDEFLALLYSFVLEHDEEGLPGPARRMESGTPVGLDKSPLDLFFDLGATQALCENYQALLGGIESPGRAAQLEELSQRLDALIAFLAGAASDDPAGDEDALADGPDFRGGPIRQQTRVLSDFDRQRLLSTIFAIELLATIETKVPADLYEDLPAYGDLLEKIENLAAAVSLANPVTDQDLRGARVLAAQRELVEKALELIQQFQSEHLGDNVKLGVFLARYGGEELAQVSFLSSLINRTRKIASVNDKRIERNGWLTDPIVVTELVNELLPRYFEGLDSASARIRQEMAPVLGVGGRELRLATFCAEARSRHDAIRASLAGDALTAPEDISSERSDKAVDLSELANQSGIPGAGPIGATAL